jgi:hypothetical protein
LKIFFHQHPFYSIKEYFEQRNPTSGSSEKWDLLIWFWFDLYLYIN